MAKRLRSFTFTRGRPGLYRWDEWLDGSPWLLTPGVDYSNRSSVKRTAYNVAKRRGLLIRTQKHPDGLVIQAFRYLGTSGVTSTHIATLRRRLSADDRKQLWKDRIYAPAWMHRYFAEINR